jgi:UDP-N-acetylmuramyl pentapeptide phosphotransferase/UDP-N-acetylglucosamine-1-phosphate transferase
LIPYEAIAAAITCAALAAATWLNRAVIGCLPDDPPRPGRKQHSRPIPLAGIVLLPVVLPWLLWLGEWWLAVAATIAAGTGYYDDRGKEHGRDLDWRWKALGLGFASLAAAAAAVDPSQQPLAFLGITALAFVLTNATNFLDNTDGVCASLSAASLLCLSQGHGAAAIVGFAALGFLPWNWPRANLFLGDAGAYLLGIVTSAMVARAAVLDARALLAIAVQLADFVQVVSARIVLGLPPWVGDRRHLTHIVQNLGLPKIAVAPVFAAIGALLAMLAR